MGSRRTTESRGRCVHKSWESALRAWKRGQDLPAFDQPCVWETTPIDVRAPDLGVYEERKVAVRGLTDEADFSTFTISTTSSKAFRNLGGDCQLVIPPRGDFAHIYRFDCNASSSVKQAFWKKVAVTIEQTVRTTDAPKLWISTHGYGVAFVHVRICEAPKYFKTKAFTT